MSFKSLDIWAVDPSGWHFLIRLGGVLSCWKRYVIGGRLWECKDSIQPTSTFLSLLEAWGSDMNSKLSAPACSWLPCSHTMIDSYPSRNGSPNKLFDKPWPWCLFAQQKSTYYMDSCHSLGCLCPNQRWRKSLCRLSFWLFRAGLIVRIWSLTVIGPVQTFETLD